MTKTKTDPQATEETPEKQVARLTDDQVVAQLLKDIPSTDEVAMDLPSKNRFYNLKDPSKAVTLRPMSFADEKAMMSNKNVNVDVLNLLLARCLGNLDVGELVQMDKLYLVMKLREISYGDEYNANISCPACRRDNKVQFNMSQLEVKPISDEFTDPREIDLPVIGKKVVVRLPRVSEENYFSNAEYAISNLWRFVNSIDGNDSLTVISKVIPQLPLKDAHALMTGISTTEFGLDTGVRFVCKHCSHQEDMELPINSDFFTGN